jgi:hypothetical protein
MWRAAVNPSMDAAGKTCDAVLSLRRCKPGFAIRGFPARRMRRALFFTPRHMNSDSVVAIQWAGIRCRDYRRKEAGVILGMADRGSWIGGCNMNDNEAWKIIGSNLAKLVSLMRIGCYLSVGSANL